MLKPKQVIRAIVEPPSDDDPHWVVSSPTLHYHVQGETRKEAIQMFEDGLVDAIEFAEQGGLYPGRQPEMLDFEVYAA